MCHLLSLTILIGFFVQDEGRSVTYRNTSVLTEADWVQNNSEGWHVLSLRAGDQWTSGTAWLVTGSNDAEVPFVALKGTYLFSAPARDESDLLIMHLRFQRQYDGTRKNSEIDWTMRSKFEPVGAEIELPLYENNTVPDDKLVLSLVRAYFIDASGREIEKRYEPYGVRDFLLGPDVKKVRRLPFANIGDTLKMTQQSRFLNGTLGDSPPTGFRFRSTQRQRSGYLPTERSDNRRTRLEELQRQATTALNDGKVSEAVSFLDRAIELDPGNWRSFSQRGSAYQRNGDYSRALQDLEKAVALNSDDVPTLNNLAWLQATCRRSKLRDGASAVKYAQKACELTDYKKGWYLDTLAAAYAEAGDFQKAVSWQTKAVELIDEKEKENAKKRLALFRSGKPCRD